MKAESCTIFATYLFGIHQCVIAVPSRLQVVERMISKVNKVGVRRRVR